MGLNLNEEKKLNCLFYIMDAVLTAKNNYRNFRKFHEPKFS